MAPHEEFLQLCAAATAGELTSDEQRRLDAHLESCADCRRMMEEYKVVAQHGAAALASGLAPEELESDRSWSVGEAEKAFLKRLSAENRSPNVAAQNRTETVRHGQRLGYRPSMFHWREVWISLAAVVFLALALVVTGYRSGVKRGTDIARTAGGPATNSTTLEEQVSDLGHERAQLLTELADEDRTMAVLNWQLSSQKAAITALKANATAGQRPENKREIPGQPSQLTFQRDEELSTAHAKLVGLQKTVEILKVERGEIASRATVLQAKVGDLTQLVRDRERELEQMQDQVAKDQDLLEHDRDIRDLIGARDLYIAEIHDVSGNGEPSKSYGRIFYTRGKRLVFYAYDLDAHHDIQEASTFQAWGRKGPDKQQALNLGVFYEDNASKKRWVLRADNPKSLEDIDAVFVTTEPNGGSQHPSGKQLLFAYLRINPNHP